MVQGWISVGPMAAMTAQIRSRQRVKQQSNRWLEHSKIDAWTPYLGNKCQDILKPIWSPGTRAASVPPLGYTNVARTAVWTAA